MTDAVVNRDRPGSPPTGLPRLLPSAPVTDLTEHLTRYGALPTVRSRSSRADFIDAVERSGLRGRGGAGFPTARKLRAVADHGRRTVVVVNGAEGEPASAKDKALLAHAPHLVLDGAVLAARALRSDEIVVVVERGYPSVADTVRTAIADRPGDDVPIRLLDIPGRYVAGEESALVNFVNGGPAKPTHVPPRPFERGVRGRPTLVQNVETLANIALIARFGVDWYRSLGPPDEPGTMLVTAAGTVARPGVYEFPLGTPVSDVLAAAGAPTGEVRALLVGGYFGCWLPANAVGGLDLTHRSLRAAGGVLGCGVVGVFPTKRCGVSESARIARYLAEETAGQCGPCVHGLAAIADAVEQLARGEARPGTLGVLRRWLADVEHRGACHLPDAAVGFLASALTVFADDFDLHEHQRRCAYADAGSVFPLPDAAGREWNWR